MTKLRHLIWTIATSGLILSASQSQAQHRQPDVGDQPGLVADDSVELDPEFRKTAVLYRTMEANHKRSWLARMVAAEVRSAYRSSWHSLMRFSMSPRAQ